MTEDQLLIDVVTALGWKEGKSWTPSDFPSLGTIRQWHNPKDNFLTPNLPAYTTDANTALSLRDELRKKGWRMTAYDQPDGSYMVVFYHDDTGREKWATDEVFARALCHAFLGSGIDNQTRSRRHKALHPKNERQP